MNIDNPKIYSFAFEGPHRSGKGTQIEKMINLFEETGIPYLVVRGDGSRPNEGKHPGDPISTWWTQMNQELKSPEGVNLIEKWDEAANRLARELIVFRDRVLPDMAKKQNASYAVLLIDRSIISRTMINPDKHKSNDRQIDEDYYPKIDQNDKKKILLDKIAPDLIFNIVADQETLINRLDKNDPKYEFRKKNIMEKAHLYQNGKDLLPEWLREKVIEIDGSSSPDEVHNQILNKVKELIE